MTKRNEELLLLLVFQQLFVYDSLNGAGSFTGAAVNAGALVDFVMIVTIFDSLYGANTYTGSAADTGIRNFACHLLSSL